MSGVGTVVTAPLRVEYLSGDYSKAFDLLQKEKVKIVYKTVSSVEPYHATIHLSPADEERVKTLLDEAKIKYYEPSPFY
ncbi:MAG: hypothetical protein QMD53_06420 [Actinomycetota bacterium]|nr:hypothetical protein [Actinomycetota bacterium]